MKSNLNTKSLIVSAAIFSTLAFGLGPRDAHAGGVISVSAPAASAVAASAGAVSTDVGGNAEDSSCIGRIECDPWLRERYKEILSKLLTNFVAVGGGHEGGVPQQMEIVSTLAARVVSFSR